LGAAGEWAHSNGESIAPLWPHQRRMIRATWMEKIMSKSNGTSKLDHAKLENRVLADSELSAVTGGRISTQHPAKVTVPDIKLSIGY
jgi:hypothetical protein